MKYERQQHSQLFIALQERKKKDGEKQLHHIHSGAELLLLFFFFPPSPAKREFCEPLVIVAAPEKVARFGKADDSSAFRVFFLFSRAIGAVK